MKKMKRPLKAALIRKMQQRIALGVALLAFCLVLPALHQYLSSTLSNFIPPWMIIGPLREIAGLMSTLCFLGLRFDWRSLEFEDRFSDAPLCRNCLYDLANVPDLDGDGEIKRCPECGDLNAPLMIELALDSKFDNAMGCEAELADNRRKALALNQLRNRTKFTLIAGGAVGFLAIVIIGLATGNRGYALNAAWMLGHPFTSGLSPAICVVAVAWFLYFGIRQRSLARERRQVIVGTLLSRKLAVQDLQHAKEGEIERGVEL